MSIRRDLRAADNPQVSTRQSRPAQFNTRKTTNSKLAVEGLLTIIRILLDKGRSTGTLALTLDV